MAPPPGRTERGPDAPKQHTAAPPAVVRQGGAKPQRAGALHAVPESPDRAANADQGEVEDVGRMEETESEASDEVLFEDVAREEEVSSRKGAEGTTAELQGAALEEKSEMAAPREPLKKVGGEGHQRRPSRDMDVPASVSDPEVPAPVEVRGEARQEAGQRRDGHKLERTSSREMRSIAGAVEPTETAPPGHVPPAAAPKAVTVAGQQEASRHRRKLSLEAVGDEKAGGVAGAQEASAAKPAVPRYPESRAAQHERKKSRDLEKEEAVAESVVAPPPGARYPEEHAARHARKKSRDMEKLAAEAGLGGQAKGEGGKAEKGGVNSEGPQEETVQAKGPGAIAPKADDVKPASNTRQPEKGGETEAPKVPAAPAVLPAALPAQPAVAPQVRHLVAIVLLILADLQGSLQRTSFCDYPCLLEPEADPP